MADLVYIASYVFAGRQGVTESVLFFITTFLGMEKSNGGTENGDLFFNIMVALVGTSVIWLAIYFESDLFPFSKYLRLRLQTMPSNVVSFFPFLNIIL